MSPLKFSAFGVYPSLILPKTHGGKIALVAPSPDYFLLLLSFLDACLCSLRLYLAVAEASKGPRKGGTEIALEDLCSPFENNATDGKTGLPVVD